MARVRVGLLVIGNEILSGRVSDVNVPHIAKALADKGLVLDEVRMVPDVREPLVAAITALRKTYDWVITTGGIGPTHDDITMPCVAESLGVPLVRHEAVAQAFRDAMGERVTEATLRMAEFPQGAELVPNGETIAPGCIAGNVLVLAGIPRVMQAMLAAALPRLPVGAPTYTKSVDVWLGESQIAAGLGQIADQWAMLDVGSYPFKLEGRYGTTLLVRGTDPVAVDEAFGAVQALVARLQGEPKVA